MLSVVFNAALLRSSSSQLLGWPLPGSAETAESEKPPHSASLPLRLLVLGRARVHSRRLKMEIMIDLFFLTIYNPSFSRGVTGFKQLGAKNLFPFSDI